MRVYLGGPINGCTDEEANGWRGDVKEILLFAGVAWRDPMARDYRGREMEPGIAAEIVEFDKCDIDECDVLLMNAPKPSYGTAMEVLYGWERAKRVIVVMPDDGTEPSPWIVYHAEVRRGSVVEAARELVATAAVPAGSPGGPPA